MPRGIHGVRDVRDSSLAQRVREHRARSEFPNASLGAPIYVHLGHYRDRHNRGTMSLTCRSTSVAFTRFLLQGARAAAKRHNTGGHPLRRTRDESVS